MNKKNIFLFSLILLLGFNALAQDSKVAVIGDFGAAIFGSSSAANEQAVADLIDTWDVPVTSLDAVVTVGDNNYSCGCGEDLNLNVGDFYGKYIEGHPDFLGGPNRFYPSLGNHDYSSPASCDDPNGTYSCDDINQGLTPYFQYFPFLNNQTYYDVEIGEAHFFIFNSNEEELDGLHATSVQGQWLQQALANSTSKWKIVVMHHPPYLSRKRGEDQQPRRLPFAAWGADAILAGHEHIYERYVVDGIPYFVNGIGGNSLSDIENDSGEVPEIQYNSDYGAMLLTIGSDELLFELFAVGDSEPIDTYTSTCVPPTCNTVVQPTPTSPHTESFENGISETTDWHQIIGDNFDWDIEEDGGSTPSGNTGPPSPADGNSFIYIESGNVYEIGTYKAAMVESPCFLLDQLSCPTFSFSASMYGVDIENLQLQLSTNDGLSYPNILWEESGNQGSAWIDGEIDLSSYAGQTIRLRFQAFTGEGNRGDIALDNLRLGECDGGPPPPDCGEVPSTWKSIGDFNGHEYYLATTEASTWQEAQNLCVAEGGYLVSLETLAEKNFLDPFISGLDDDESESGEDERVYYIGLRRIGNDIRWVSPGEEIFDNYDNTYNPWEGGAPNPSYDFVTLRKWSPNQSTVRWGTENGLASRLFICEKECDSAPSCQLSLSNTPTTNLTASAGSFTFNISASDDFTWSVSEDADWIQPADIVPNTGMGNAVVTVNFPENNSGSVRDAVITVSCDEVSRTFTIYQNSGVFDLCSNGVQDPGELGVDCGGTCPTPCPDDCDEYDIICEGVLQATISICGDEMTATFVAAGVRRIKVLNSFGQKIGDLCSVWNSAVVDCPDSETLTIDPQGSYLIQIIGDTNCSQTIDLSGGVGFAFDDKLTQNNSKKDKEQKLLSKDISLFPNPAKNELFLQLNSFSDQSASIHIFNHLGQKIKSVDFEKISEEPLRLNTSNLADGLYYISVNVGTDSTFIQTFIIQN